MSRYESRRKLAAKAEWEGGPAEFIFVYGIHPGDLPRRHPARRGRGGDPPGHPGSSRPRNLPHLAGRDSGRPGRLNDPFSEIRHHRTGSTAVVEAPASFDIYIAPGDEFPRVTRSLPDEKQPEW